jgi:hypothetical protein
MPWILECLRAWSTSDISDYSVRQQETAARQPDHLAVRPERLRAGYGVPWVPVGVVQLAAVARGYE